MESQTKEVFSYIEDHREEMIRYLQRLVAIDTQTPPGLNYDKVCSLMADKLGEYGCDA